MHTSDGPYQEVVERGLRWMMKTQKPDGGLMTDESMYSHGIATIALAEAYGMTKDPALAKPVKDAVDFIYDARNRRLGGWRYDPGQVGDTSVLGWQIMALASAKRAGIDVPSGALDVGRDWLERVKDPWKPGLFSYQPKRRPTPAMTAEAMFVRLLLGDGREGADMASAASYVLDHPPDWELESNTYYWYYGTLALFQYGGEEWEQWNEVVKDQLLIKQHDKGSLAGSWDPEGKWAIVGGRVYQTAICTLTLEVYYRYLPLYMAQQGGRKKPGS